MNDEDTKPQLYRLLIKLRTGGVLVSSDSCSVEEINHAKQRGNFTTDSDGFEYVFLAKSRDIEPV